MMQNQASFTPNENTVWIIQTLFRSLSWLGLILVLEVGLGHKWAGLDHSMTETLWGWKWLSRRWACYFISVEKLRRHNFCLWKNVTDESCKQGTRIKVNLDVISISSALKGTYHSELMGDHRCWWDMLGTISKHAASEIHLELPLISYLCSPSEMQQTWIYSAKRDSLYSAKSSAGQTKRWLFTVS